MTIQRHEILIVDGLETSMAFCPPLPKVHPRITSSHSDERDELDEIMMACTNCWRGYVGTWEIREGTFYLVNLRGGLRLRGDGPLLADWFTGEFSAPKEVSIKAGDVEFTVRLGIHFEIESGVVMVSHLVDDPSGEDAEPDEDIPF